MLDVFVAGAHLPGEPFPDKRDGNIGCARYQLLKQHSSMVEWNSNLVERSENLRVRVASRLRALRDELGLTIQKLADRSGVSRAMISRIERDESCPTTPLLNKLSVGLGVQLSTLLGDTSYRATRLRERAPMATRLPAETLGGS